MKQMILSGFRGNTSSFEGRARANHFRRARNFSSSEKMSKRKPTEDLKDGKTGKITRFFSKEPTITKERTVTGKSKLFITEFKFVYFTFPSADGASINSLVCPK